MKEKIQRLKDPGFLITQGIEVFVSVTVVATVGSQLPRWSPERQFIEANFVLMSLGIFLGSKPLRIALGKIIKYLSSSEAE